MDEDDHDHGCVLGMKPASRVGWAWEEFILTILAEAEATAAPAV